MKKLIVSLLILFMFSCTLSNKTVFNGSDNEFIEQEEQGGYCTEEGYYNPDGKGGLIGPTKEYLPLDN